MSPPLFGGVLPKSEIPPPGFTLPAGVLFFPASSLTIACWSLAPRGKPAASLLTDRACIGCRLGFQPDQTDGKSILRSCRIPHGDLEYSRADSFPFRFPVCTMNHTTGV